MPAATAYTPFITHHSVLSAVMIVFRIAEPEPAFVCYFGSLLMVIRQVLCLWIQKLDHQVLLLLLAHTDVLSQPDLHCMFLIA
jgi:hypothetical protein